MLSFWASGHIAVPNVIWENPILSSLGNSRWVVHRIRQPKHRSFHSPELPTVHRALLPQPNTPIAGSIQERQLPSKENQNGNILQIWDCTPTYLTGRAIGLTEWELHFRLPKRRWFWGVFHSCGSVADPARWADVYISVPFYLIADDTFIDKDRNRKFGGKREVRSFLQRKRNN